MAFLFGGGSVSVGNSSSTKPNPIRDIQSKLKLSIRILTRESMKMRNDEDLLIKQIKYHAKANKIKFCELKAKELARLRSHMMRLETSIIQCQSLSHHLSTVAATQTLQDSVKNISQLLKKINTQTDAKSILNITRQYSIENEQFQLKQEAIEESMDNVLEAPNEELESDATVAAIFEELQLDSSLLKLQSQSNSLLADSNQFSSQLSALKVPFSAL